MSKNYDPGASHYQEDPQRFTAARRMGHEANDRHMDEARAKERKVSGRKTKREARRK